MAVGRRTFVGLGALGLAGGLGAAQTAAAQTATSQTAATPTPTTGVLPALAGGGASAGAAGPSESFPLWLSGLPEAAPAGLSERFDGGVLGVTAPRVELFRPAASLDRRQALLVIPGGGYTRLSMENEGYSMARYLAARGYTAGVLVHRLPAEGWRAGPLAPLQDAQRAMRLLRQRAAGLVSDADRIGVVGFSAGGHLVGMLATRFAASIYAPVDAADSLSAKPGFAALIYPVASMSAVTPTMSSRRMLLGDHPTAAQIAAWSADRQVTAETPPTFLAHAADDPVVPFANSILMFQALQAAGVRSELHLFDRGGHGFGMDVKTTASAWPQLLMDWGRLGGLLS